MARKRWGEFLILEKTSASATVQAAVETLAERLRARGEKVSFAESCTGGLVSAQFAALAGVSDVYCGAVVAYANQVKIEVLGVPEKFIQEHGAVSSQVARAMAQGANRILHSNWAAGVTGVAGPSGGTPQKPVGTVWFAIVGPAVEWTGMMRFDGDRAAIQEQSTKFIVESLALALDQGLEGLVKRFRTPIDV